MTRGKLLAGAYTTWLLCAVMASWALWSRSLDWYGSTDLRIATSVGRAMLAGNFTVYADHPEAQMGPLALALAGSLPRWLFVGLAASFVPPIFHWTVAPHLVSRRAAAFAGVGAALVLVPWIMNPLTGHIDDPLVFLGAAAVIGGLRGDRRWLVCAGFVLAIAGKPTAIVLLPLLFVRNPRLGALAVVLGGLIWLPFVAADVEGFLHAGSGITVVWPGSLPHVLGESVGADYPAWVRPAQLLGGLAICWVAARRGEFAMAVLGAFAWRALLEPAPLPGYMLPVLLFAVVVSVQGGRSMKLPAVLFATWGMCHFYSYGLLVAPLRLTVLVAVVWIVLRARAVVEIAATAVCSDAPVHAKTPDRQP